MLSNVYYYVIFFIIAIYNNDVINFHDNNDNARIETVLEVTREHPETIHGNTLLKY